MTLNADGTLPEGCPETDRQMCDQQQCWACYVAAPKKDPTDWSEQIIDRPARCRGCNQLFVVYPIDGTGTEPDPDSYAWVRRDETGRWIRFHDRCRPADPVAQAK